MHALEKQLRAQSDHVRACGQCVLAAHDPRLKSAWIDAIVRLMDASAATGSVIADLKWAPRTTLLNVPLRLHLPPLPPLPDLEEAPPPPPQIRKTTSGGFFSRNSGLAFLSSPACGGEPAPDLIRGGSHERSECETVGGEAQIPLRLAAPGTRPGLLGTSPAGGGG
jgi:hypothetical protein